MRARFLVFSIVLSVFGCGGGSVPTLDTGLPRETPANEVTPAEAVAACERYEELANEALGVDVQRDVTCAIAGIASDLTGGASCRQAQAACLSETPTGTGAIDFECEGALSFAPSGCTATIGELEDCVNALSAGLDRFTGQIDCGLVNHPDRAAALAEDAATVAMPETYPACASLSDECLGLLGWVDETLGPVTGP